MPPKRKIGKLREGERGEGAVAGGDGGGELNLKRGGNAVAVHGRKAQKEEEKEGKEEEGCKRLVGWALAGKERKKKKRKERKEGRRCRSGLGRI